jgi:hypothetical protein
MPRLYVLQSNSPQCDKRGSGYIEDAEPGHFWKRYALDPIHDGEVGIHTIYCGMDYAFVEWPPGRLGFPVARHDARPADTELVQDGSQQRPKLIRRSTNNVIEETRDLYLLVEGRGYVFSCTGTKHTFAKQWQSYFHEFRHPETGAVLPSFARKYRLTTYPDSNGLGQWFGVKFKDLGWVSEAEYFAAREFSRYVASGAQRVEPPIYDGV